MKVLIVKLSSLGDVIHTLPALTDAAKAYPNIEFDWVIEESLQAIPALHDSVVRVIPMPLRGLRKKWPAAILNGQFKRLFLELRANSYDLVIDAQGLMKSAVLTKFCRGVSAGFDWPSARESIASLFYTQKASASWSEHAVIRSRKLFSQLLNYSFDNTVLDYGLKFQKLPQQKLKHQRQPQLLQQQTLTPYCVFLHGTTWNSKLWPESFWIELGQHLDNAGYKIKLFFGNSSEEERARQIARKISHGAEVLPALGLNDIVPILTHAHGIVSVDTGLGHLAAALEIPTVSLYGPTDPIRTGLFGKHQVHLAADKQLFSCSPCLRKSCANKIMQKKFPEFQSPCLGSLTPQIVMKELMQLMETPIVTQLKNQMNTQMETQNI